jgi:hypothetical protein
MQTAAATFVWTALQDCDELLGDTALMHAKISCFAHRFLITIQIQMAIMKANK